MSVKPLISVVVCTKNEEKYIENCLKALSKQVIKPELIVVDGHSSDKTVEIAKKYADKIVYDSGRGLGEARNIGWKAAKSNIVAYCDADSIPPKDWTRKIAELMDKYDCVSGPLSAYDGSRIMKLKFKVWADLFPRMLSLGGYNCVWGANMAFKKEVLKKYPFRLKFLEDYDIGYRLRKNKVKMKFHKSLLLPVSSRRFANGFHRTAFRFYVLRYLKMKLLGKTDSGYY